MFKNYLNIFKKPEIIKEEVQDIKEIDLAVSIHLGNHNLYDELMSYIKNINVQYDLYINLVKGFNYNEFELNSMKEKILCDHPNAIVTIFDNIGMDSGSFLKHIHQIRCSKKNYKYILKLHSKTNDKWRHELIDPLLRDTKSFENCYNKISQPNIGVVYCKKWNMVFEHERFFNHDTHSMMYGFLNALGIFIKYPLTFCGGTIFLIKISLINDLFDRLEKNISMEELLNSTGSGRGWYSYTFENILSYLPKLHGMDTELVE